MSSAWKDSVQEQHLNNVISVSEILDALDRELPMEDCPPQAFIIMACMIALIIKESIKEDIAND